jgi:shikimate kinase
MTTQLPKNIVLIGFMGAGKSTVARRLEQILHYPLIDTDGHIEAAAGMTIAEIFAAEGEAGFRERESALLREIAASGIPRHIISTGGGIVVRPENRLLLRALGYVVWLRATEKVIHERTRHNRDRPLLYAEDPRRTIHELLTVRTPFYAEAAHLIVDTEGLSSEEVAVGILESARYFFAS